MILTNVLHPRTSPRGCRGLDRAHFSLDLVNLRQDAGTLRSIAALTSRIDALCQALFSRKDPAAWPEPATVPLK